MSRVRFHGAKWSWGAVASISSAREIPRTRRKVVKPDQKNSVALAVLRDRQQVLDAVESRLARKVMRDVAPRDRRDRIDDNRSAVHGVAPANLHVRPRPDADAARDLSAADPFAKAFGEHHGGESIAGTRDTARVQRFGFAPQVH